MRRYSVKAPPRNSDKETIERWLIGELRDIETSFRLGDVGPIADSYTVSNFTETRTLDASTATLSDILDVFCTFIDDLQQRGTKRGTYDG